MTQHETARQVAVNVRSARSERGLTLDRLAALSGVSKGALVKLETGEGNPALGTLVRVAEAMQLPVPSLLEVSDGGGVTVAVPGEPLWTGPAGGSATLLLTVLDPAPVELWRWVLEPGERYESAAHTPGVTETVQVLAGSLHLEVGTEALDVVAGGVAHYRADADHVYANTGASTCQVSLSVHLPFRGAADRPGS